MLTGNELVAVLPAGCAAVGLHTRVTPAAAAGRNKHAKILSQRAQTTHPFSGLKVLHGIRKRGVTILNCMSHTNVHKMAEKGGAAHDFSQTHHLQCHMRTNQSLAEQCVLLWMQYDAPLLLPTFPQAARPRTLTFTGDLLCSSAPRTSCSKCPRCAQKIYQP
jgi:hypothetical protein